LSPFCNNVSAALHFIRPRSPISAKSVPAGEAWLHEPKLDGYRLRILKSGRAVRLYSRDGHEWTERLATLADALAGIPGRSAVIDAELCFLSGIGAPGFAGLQLALRSRQHHKLTVFAFDLLHRGGVDLCPLPLGQRKDLLATLLHRSKVDCLHLVATFPDGAKLLASAERKKLEGIVSKRRSSPYRSGECKDWRKIKTVAWRAANRERWRLFERGKP
jgi:bifunctional non-homologous end joining protein LigD